MSKEDNLISLDKYRDQQKEINSANYIAFKIDFLYLPKSDELIINGHSIPVEEDIKDIVTYKNRNESLLYMVEAFIKSTKTTFSITLDINGKINRELCKSVFYETMKTMWEKDKKQWSLFLLTLGINDKEFNLNGKTLINNTVWSSSIVDLYKDDGAEEQAKNSLPFVITYLALEAIDHFAHRLNIDRNNYK